MYLGIDLTCSERKPTACAALDETGKLQDHQLLKDDRSIIAWVEGWRPQVIAIDAPLSLPRGLCCLDERCPCRPLAPGNLKAAERELLRRGISLYVTSKRSIIRPMIHRAMSLRRTFEDMGIPALEVYPYACKVALFGKPIPKKTRRSGRAWLQERLNPLILGLPSPSPPLSHDRLDAILAAYTAHLFAHGKTEAIGDADEGLIYVPSFAP